MLFTISNLKSSIPKGSDNNEHYLELTYFQKHIYDELKKVTSEYLHQHF